MTSPLVEIPLPLRHAIELGKCVLFLGAGIGKHFKQPGGKTLPGAVELANEINNKFSLKCESDDLSKVAELLQVRGRRPELDDFLRTRLAEATPDNTIKWLCSRTWRAIFTTNYDRGIENGYERLSNPPQNPISIARTSDIVHIDTRFDVPIYHIHGAIFGETNRLVISQTDYARFRETRKMLFEVLQYNFATSTFLYIGYSHRDPNWYLLLNELAEDFQVGALPPSFRVDPNTAQDDVEILKARGIESIDADLEEFVAVATTQIESPIINNIQLKTLRTAVPSNLLDTFDINPVPVVRFLTSWQYVNQAPFSDTPNSHTFFRGDKPNWALIGAGISFKRDIESDLYDQVLDYVTSSAKKPMTQVVLGPAGYGITTIMMNLAGRLVEERIGPVYFLRPGREVLEGDVEFGISVASSEIVCFFIDNVSSCAQQLSKVVAHLRDAKRTAVFICGSRTNEWRQLNIRLPHNENILDALSEEEIDRLLDCLKSNNELNKLDALTPELQRVVIREKHGKELLVVLREATEQKGFDAILEDEFYGIIDDKCRDIYLAVCCFHQHDSYIRDNLICDITNLAIEDFYAYTKKGLDGVIIDECIDTAANLYAFRTRHRIISHIVWERCGERTHKDKILQSALAHLNLNNREDAKAFEAFIRDDWMIDNIRGLDNKIKFFDLACKKDPEGPYIRQHYARMLYREKLYDFALAQVELGIKINPRSPPRVLIHTKGKILGALALQAENIEIGRRRLVQAEDTLRKTLNISPRDAYSHHALATLYLDWAKHSKIDEESATYLTKAEEAVGLGIHDCKEKDALWIVSAEIQEWIGNQPSRIKALETAVQVNPGSIFARHVLGRAYRNLGKNDKALEVLGPTIKHHTNEFRSFIEYSLAMLALGKPLREIIAVLEIASITGLSDAWYIAHLGGMHFLNKNFQRAETVFSEAIKRELPPSNLNNVISTPAS